MELEALINEWFSGRDARGEESPRFALGWRDSVTPFGIGRSYVPDTAMLSAVLCSELGDSVYGVNVRLALGADGGLDLRVETDGTAGIVMERWRGGDLSIVADQGRRGADIIAHAARVAQVVADDPPTTTLEDAAGAISLLKQHRNYLRDRIEAGGAVDVADVLVAIEVKRAVLDVKMIEYKAEIDAELAIAVEEIV